MSEKSEAGKVAISAMAIGLWCVVGGLLTYGIIETVIKAAALFGGAE